MKNDIKRYVDQCEVCQRNKYEATKSAGVLQPLPIPDKILEDWTMDFIEGLPKAGGMNVIMVVVDRLTKYAYFITLKHPFSAKQVALTFIEAHKISGNLVSPLPFLEVPLSGPHPPCFPPLQHVLPLGWSHGHDPPCHLSLFHWLHVSSYFSYDFKEESVVSVSSEELERDVFEENKADNDFPEDMNNKALGLLFQSEEEQILSK
ncbi:putative integrase [Cucumis melo var. makuwa]|uniref:Putative integrase n=1 Tax=Cucumis melo var. makuwa TaxID=1194695 RepID=A0A5D3CSZ3_CUCMM|nr:putative integrase [Cucumis melo var. makuwa]